MGWTGDFMYWNRKETNKDLLMRAYPSIKEGFEQGRYKLSQKGSDVYMLYQCDIPTSKDYGKWYVAKYLCRRRQNEFMTKDIDAIDNDCFDFPKDWLKYLDAGDSYISRYLKAREEFEQKQKKAEKYDFGDVVKCKAVSSISWSDGHRIAEGGTFYVRIKVLNPYASKRTKSFVVVEPRKPYGESWQFASTMYRVNATSFKYAEKQKMTESDIMEVLKKAEREAEDEAKRMFGIA